MKNLLKFYVLLLTMAVPWFSQELQAQNVIWREDFENGFGNWTINYTGSGFFGIQNGVFRAEKTVIEGTLTSDWISIAGYDFVKLSLEDFILGRGVGDYIEGYYKLDPAGPAIPFYENGNWIQNIISGSQVQLIFKIKNNEFWFLVYLNDIFTLDNIQITEHILPTLYAMDNGEWHEREWVWDEWEYRTIWSWDDYSGDQNSCDCFPDASTVAVIGDNVTVDMDEDGTARGIKVENNGELIFADEAALTVAGGGNVSIESNGRIDRNSENAKLVFSDNDVGSKIVVNNGTIDIRDIEINGQRSTINIAGNGTLNVNNNFLINGDNAVVSNSFSGSFTIGNLLIEGSAIQFSNNNSLSITGNLRFNDDNSRVTNNSLLSVNNLAVNNNGDNGNVVTNNAGATFNILSNIDLNDGDFTINNSGTINQHGSFADIDNGSNFYNLNGATWNFSGSNFDSNMSSVLSCDNGVNVFNYNRSGNQNIIIPVDAYSTLTISASGRKSAGSNLDVNQDLNITGTARLNVNGHDINLAGNWNNTSSHGSSFEENNSSVTFDGNTQVIFNSSGGEVFEGLEVNNNSLLLGTEVTIESSMTFTKGIVKTTHTALLVIADDATANLNISSYVDGPVSKIGDDDFIFPIGKNGILAPVVIASINGSAATRFTAEYFSAPAPNGSNLPSSGLTHVSAIEYWDLKRVSSDNAEALVGLGTLDKDRSQIYNETSEDAVIAHYNENSNEWEGFPSAGFIVGGDVFSIVTQSAVSSFSPFTFGSSGGISPLPVTLVTFGGESAIGGNRLFWQTTSETENDYFAVERSKDGQSWETLGEVTGNGSISQGKNYSFLDSSPFYGSAFYRLKQVDFNGAFEYSNIISVHNVQLPEPGIKLLYPNPVRDKVTLQYVSSGEGELSLSVVNQQGILQIIKRYQLQGKHAEIRVDLSGLAPGLYFLVLQHHDSRIVEKVIKE